MKGRVLLHPSSFIPVSRFIVEKARDEMAEQLSRAQLASLRGQFELFDQPSRQEQADLDHLIKEKVVVEAGEVLIGVGSYKDREYSELPVCVCDVTEVARQLYSNESGFTSASIKVLVDDGTKPTRAAILSCLQEVADIRLCDPLGAGHHHPL